MPKKRQIPFLFPRPLAQAVSWVWKPSKRLRDAGFQTLVLGRDEAAAIMQALEQNRQVKAWEERAVAGEGAPTSRRPPPRVIRFGELVARYKAHDAFTGLRASTRNEYASRLRSLGRWALDGQLPVKQIDRELVVDLRDELVGGSSPWRAASMLRILRLLLGWAKDQGLLAVNAAEKVNIPEPPARRTRMNEAAREAIVEAAEALGHDAVALAVPLAFWLLQRQADILQLNRFAWQELHGDATTRGRDLLVNARGRVFGFRLWQQKTGTAIDAPLPPFLHAAVEQRMRAGANGWLFPHPDDASRSMPSWAFQRRFRDAQEAAVVVAIGRGDLRLAEAIDACQFRDLRRTGMIYYRDAGASVPNITALSGHYVLGRKTIMDTYMPGDTAGACACVIAGLSALARDRSDVAAAT